MSAASRADRGPAPTPALGRRGWRRDITLGVGLAFRGSRLRTALTAVGIGMSVAVLVFASALPNAIQAHQTRVDNRSSAFYSGGYNRTLKAAMRDGDGNVLLQLQQNTTFHNRTIAGNLLQAIGRPQALTPVGLTSTPRPGEIVVSPALKRVLENPSNSVLRDRIPGRIVGTVERSGLGGPKELLWYGGSRELRAHGLADGSVHALVASGGRVVETTNVFLKLLMTVGIVVLLFPIAILVSTAARFGSARRDARLAALRLMGSTRGEIARIAAGESLAAAVLGLLIGAALFAGSLAVIEHVSVAGLSVFRADLKPSPLLTALVVVLVPLLSLGVTIMSMRRVLVEPLAVSRRGGTRRRRLWWRPLPMIAGFGTLAPLARGGSHPVTNHPAQISFGIIAVLIGVAMLLPWLVEAIVRRSRGWSLSSQLAVRVLQRDAASASRIVSGVAVAVAGAIALQMLIATAKVEVQTPLSIGGPAPSTAGATVNVTAPVGRADALRRALAQTRGVDRVRALASETIVPNGAAGGQAPTLTIGSCEDLRELTTITTCHDGDAFRAVTSPVVYSAIGDSYVVVVDVPRSGAKVTVESGAIHRAVRWRIPSDATTVQARLDDGNVAAGIYVTPAAAPPVSGSVPLRAYVHLDAGTPDALERVRTAAAQFSPFAQVQQPGDSFDNHQFTSIRRALIAGAGLLMLLIAASLLVTTLEQLSERRRILATLAAFGTPASILRRALVWQIAIPVVLGLVIAMIVGEALGTVLLRVAGAQPRTDLAGTLDLIGVGASAIIAVTALALPLLRRVAAPSGLRTE